MPSGFRHHAPSEHHQSTLARCSHLLLSTVMSGAQSSSHCLSSSMKEASDEERELDEKGGLMLGRLWDWGEAYALVGLLGGVVKYAEDAPERGEEWAEVGEVRLSLLGCSSLKGAEKARAGTQIGGDSGDEALGALGVALAGVEGAWAGLRVGADAMLDAFLAGGAGAWTGKGVDAFLSMGLVRGARRWEVVGAEADRNGASFLVAGTVGGTGSRAVRARGTASACAAFLGAVARRGEALSACRSPAKGERFDAKEALGTGALALAPGWL